MAKLGSWCRRRVASVDAYSAVVAGEGAARCPVSELEAENSRLRGELADAILDVEVLRQARVYFATGSR